MTYTRSESGPIETGKSVNSSVAEGGKGDDRWTERISVGMIIVKRTLIGARSEWTVEGIIEDSEIGDVVDLKFHEGTIDDNMSIGPIQGRAGSTMEIDLQYAGRLVHAERTQAPIFHI